MYLMLVLLLLLKPNLLKFSLMYEWAVMEMSISLAQPFRGIHKLYMVSNRISLDDVKVLVESHFGEGREQKKEERLAF